MDSRFGERCSAFLPDSKNQEPAVASRYRRHRPTLTDTVGACQRRLSATLVASSPGAAARP